MESIFILFYMEFQLDTCKVGKDLERSYVVYARILGPPESHTIESAFMSHTMKTIDVFTMYTRKIKILNFSPGSVLAQPREWR